MTQPAQHKVLDGSFDNLRPLTSNASLKVTCLPSGRLCHKVPDPDPSRVQQPPPLAPQHTHTTIRTSDPTHLVLHSISSRLLAGTAELPHIQKPVPHPHTKTPNDDPQIPGPTSSAVQVFISQRAPDDPKNRTSPCCETNPLNPALTPLLSRSPWHGHVSSQRRQLLLTGWSDRASAILSETQTHEPEVGESSLTSSSVKSISLRFGLPPAELTRASMVQ